MKVVKRIRQAIKIARRLKLAKGKLTYASGAALAIGLIAELAGVDLAPAEVDAVVTALATVGVFYGRWRANQEEV
jgi:hypothetical protein